MKTRRPHLLAFLPVALAAAAAPAARDPFWPIGYTPPLPAAQVTAPAEPALKPRDAPPAEKPVTEADWARGRKALTISGFTKSVRADKQERTLVMINSKSHTVGDTVTFVHDDIRFQWRVDAISEKQITLTPLTAARVTAKTTTLPTKQ